MCDTHPHRYAVATWTEFNHTQAAAVAEKREEGGGGVWTVKKKQKQQTEITNIYIKKSTLEIRNTVCFPDRDSRKWDNMG